MSAADEAYDRLHGVDGHTQAATPRHTSWRGIRCRHEECVEFGICLVGPPPPDLTATIRRVSRPRGVPTKNELMLMARVKERAEVAAKDYRDCVVTVLLNGASFAEVSKATGLSTNTLQRWKREAKD